MKKYPDSFWVNLLHDSTGINKKKLSIYWKQFKLKKPNNFSSFSKITESLKIKSKKEEKFVEYSYSNKVLTEFWIILGPKGSHVVYMSTID